MSRLTIAALTLASVVGGVGGALVATHAVIPIGADPTASDSGNDTTSPDGNGGKGGKGKKTGATDAYDDPTGPRPDGPLFYFADGAIHDGELTVAAPDVSAENLVSLARVSGGWLLVEGGETADTSSVSSYRGTFVSTDGVVWGVDEWVGAWDIGPAGERMMFWKDDRFWVADFVSRTVTDLNLVEGAGAELDFMTAYDAVPWVRIAGADMLTVWDSREGGRLVLTETQGFTHTAVGPPAVSAPATSPGGVLVVADTGDDPYGGDAPCLTGGELRAPSDEWWRNCDVTREDVVSPYSPDGERLLALDVESASVEPGGYVVLNAGTGETVARWAVPDGTVDASWSADRTVTIVATDPDDPASTVLWQCGTGGICEETLELPGISTDDVVLGTP